MDVIIIGAGIGGLTLGLMLHAAGLPVQICEAAPEIRPLGVGINLLPHAMRELEALQLGSALEARGVLTQEAAFFNRYGQLIYREPLGRAAGYDWPQVSIHRGDLQAVLLEAFLDRAGRERLLTGWQCVAVERGAGAAMARFANGRTLTGRAIVAAEGIHSTVRRQFYPDEGEPIYSGVNMWRGVTRWPAILGGAAMIRVGWFAIAKLVIYPIRNAVDGEGRQLVNWVVEIETPVHQGWNWTREAKLADFIDRVADWHFDWLDVPAFFRASDFVLEYPMVDKDPLPRWSFERVTLMGDAAHPMYPRGSNGAGQAILDARALADCLAATPDDPAAALQAYEARRLGPTAAVVRANRSVPPDAILGEVYRRTGDQPFQSIDTVISKDELKAITDNYKRVAGYDKTALAR